MPDWLARILRTVLQLGAAGAFTAVITEGSKLVDPKYAPLILTVSALIVTACQNAIEQATGRSILKPADADMAKA